MYERVRVCCFATWQVEISKSYGPAEWREDLKRFVRVAGADNRPAVFLFSDTQVRAFITSLGHLSLPGGCAAWSCGHQARRSMIQSVSRFTVSSAQIKAESFVEDINNLLNSGEVRGTPRTPTCACRATHTQARHTHTRAVQHTFRCTCTTLTSCLAAQVPNMFPYDERAAVLEACRVASKKEGLTLDSAVELWCGRV